MINNKSWSLIKNSVIIYLVAFIINLVWELLHAQLYLNYNFGASSLWMCFKATFFDAGFVTVMYLVIFIINKDIDFYQKKIKTRDWSIIIILGIITAWFIEARALREGRWGYNEFMPLIYGIGLTPLIQLATTSVITLIILKWMYKKSFRKTI